MNKNKQNLNFNNFYPFTRKNKTIPIVKKIIGIIALISMVFYFFTNISILLLIENKNLEAKFLFFFKKSLLSIYPFSYLVFIIIAFKKEKNAAKVYSISTWYGVLLIAYNTYFGIRSIFLLKNLVAEHAKINLENQLFLSLQILNGIVIALGFVLILLEFYLLVILHPKTSQYKIHLFNQKIIKKGRKSVGKKTKTNK